MMNLNTPVTSTEAPDNNVGEIFPITTNKLVPAYTVENLTGSLYWVSQVKAKRFIVIEPDAVQLNADGDIVRRGVELNLDATAVLNGLYDRCLFEGDRVSVGIRVLRGTTLEAELAAGLGIHGNKELKGLGIDFA